MQFLRWLAVLVLGSVLLGCSPNSAEPSQRADTTATPIGTPHVSSATSGAASPALTPVGTDVAMSVDLGTPAGAATPALTPSSAAGAAVGGCDAWRVDQPIALPSPFAPNFPVPANMKWYKTSTVRTDAHTQLQVIGIAPLNLPESAQFLMIELPKAGYEITSTDSESNEADGLYKGNGWIGSYRISMLDNCDTSTMWSIRVLKL